MARPPRLISRDQGQMHQLFTTWTCNYISLSQQGQIQVAAKIWPQATEKNVIYRMPRKPAVGLHDPMGLGFTPRGHGSDCSLKTSRQRKALISLDEERRSGDKDDGF